MTDAQFFISGAICMGYFVAGVFFLKFWRKTRDSLFLAFASAFWMLAAIRLVLSALDDHSELRTFLYLGRLMAVMLILAAIFQKNRRKKTGALEAPA